jgi:hypothetical protein
MTLPKRSKIKEAKAKIKDLFSRMDDVMVLHYSCESFDKEATPRITCICVGRLNSGVSNPFDFQDIADHRFSPEEELRMLARFLNFARENSSKTWILWKGDSNKYGFSAIVDRFEYLRSTLPREERGAFIKPTLNLLSVTSLLRKIYGENSLTDGDHGALRMMARKNGLRINDMAAGLEEPELFRAGRLLVLRRSVEQKVQSIKDLLWRAYDGDIRMTGRVDPMGWRAVTSWLLNVIWSVLGRQTRKQLPPSDP